MSMQAYRPLEPYRPSIGRSLPLAVAAVPGILLAQQEQQRPLTPAATQESDLFSSGFFLRLGFSFIVGLAVGYALKIAFKVALVVGGLLLVALFALQYSGIVDVNWSGMESNYDGLVGWLAAYAGALKEFMMDNLSSAASFTAGLLLGLRL
jgi:uncharacterized membrane protein (Fun14 family)